MDTVFPRTVYTDPPVETNPPGTQKAVCNGLPSHEYLPASPRFPQQYSEEIANHQDRALADPGELGEWDGTNICAILPLTLDFLYMGQTENARVEFYNRYTGTDADVKWNEVLQTVENSPLYTP